MPSLEELFGIGTEHVDDFPPPFASAVVYKNDSLNKVIAKKWNSNLGCWQRIAQGKAGVDDASVIQSALDSLTQGRTWKERVVLSGNFIIQSPIIPTSYTVLEVYGKLKLADKANCEIINITDAVDLEKFELRGGIFDGNASNQTNGYQVINLNPKNLKDVIITGVTVINAYRHGIRLAEQSGGSNFYKEISSCFVYNVGVGAVGYGIYCDYASGTRIIGNYIETIQAVDGIEMGHGDYVCKNNILVGCPIQFPFASKTLIEGNTIINARSAISNDINTADYVRIIDNAIINASPLSLYGAIRCTGSYCTICDNYVELANDQRAIHVPGTSNVTIENNKLVGLGDKIGIGIDISGTSENILVIKNRIYNFNIGFTTARDYVTFKHNIIDTCNYGYYVHPYSTSARQAIYHRIIQNRFLNIATEAIYLGLNGYNPLTFEIYDNYGGDKSTKNSGTASITGDGAATTFNIAHGLVSTPSYVNVQPKAGAPAPTSIDWNDKDIILTFATAPTTGTYYYAWEARV